MTSPRLRNKFEKRIYTLLKKTKVSFQYETERIPYVLAGHYIPDFILNTINGKVYIETKGHLRREDKRKLCAVKKQHPEMDLRILFYALNKTNGKWATKNGFKFAFETIPEDWIKGF